MPSSITLTAWLQTVERLVCLPADCSKTCVCVAGVPMFHGGRVCWGLVRPRVRKSVYFLLCTAPIPWTLTVSSFAALL